jgi:hypothetical protein
MPCKILVCATQVLQQWLFYFEFVVVGYMSDIHTEI